MRNGRIFGLMFLAALWIWLCFMLFSRGGITLKNILIALMSGIIVFVPLWKKYVARK